jgi:hypothetical protein
MTVDMTNNRVPYGLLTDDEKAALHEHEKAGGSFEFTVSGKPWEKANECYCGINCVYRTVPLPKTQDVIAWEKLPDWVEWVARDRDGEVFAYDAEPRLHERDWGGLERHHARIDDFPGIVVQIGTCDWKESKQRRPK